MTEGANGLMRTYNVEIVGKTDLLHHWDNIAWSDEMDRWRADPSNKKVSKAGDDRTPAFRWLGSLYHDGEVVALPQDNLMRALMEGGAMVPVPGGKNGKTFKSQTQSGMVIAEQFWPLKVSGKTIPVAILMALRDVADFAQHVSRVRDLGFDLFLKRAKIGSSKHIRVRPIFSKWSCSGTVYVWDDQITLDVLRSIFDCAGRYKGVGDWRPGGKTPGPYGTFSVSVRE